MKNKSLTVILALCTMSLSAQNTWFKYIPGWLGNNSYVLNDTIYSFCATSKFDPFVVIGFNLNHVSLSNGNLYKSDSLFYFSKKVKSFTNLEYRTKNNSINLANHNFILAANYGDSIASDIKWQSDLFLYPNFEKLNINLNYDTFDTRIEGLFEINDNRYALVNWIKKLDKLSSISSSRLLRINDSNNSTLIYTKINTSYDQNSHNLQMQGISEDNQSSKYLFIKLIDLWDWHGSPAQYEAVLQKIDTTGKLIWECRPSGNQDTINTTDFQIVQLPNGNILCSWLDDYYRPYKKPGDPYQFELPNYKVTFWFAEIDYQTGSRLWVKNNRQFLDWKMGTTASDFVYSQLTDALKTNDGIVWCGHRYVDRPSTQSWTALPYLFKTDFNGNPVWYREYNLAANDTTDKGFKPYSFMLTPDNGFLLTGEYLRKWGVPSDTSQPQGVFQTAALLKLDSNGCYVPGCNAKDNLIKIKVPYNVCHVFPNPASNFISIQYPIGINNWKITLIDINGKIIFQSQESLTRIPLTEFPNGGYIIELSNPEYNHFETHQIIIQH